MGEFLENLKKAVEEGDFNSAAAKKINEIDNLANQKENAENLLEKRLDESGVKVVDEKEVLGSNTEYEKKMIEIRQKELILKQIATLQDIEHMVELSIQDMMDYVNSLVNRFDENDENNKKLFDEINKIKAKYNY